MTKEKIYNTIVDVTKETGQGVPQFMFKSGDMFLVEEMIDEGLLQRNIHTFSYFPDDITISLTGIYCVEAEDDRHLKTLHLTFLRHYLRRPEENNELMPSNAEIVNGNMDKYKQFLIDNLEGIEAIKELKHITIGVELTDEQKTYLKSRAWYSTNGTVAESLKDLTDGDKDLRKFINATEQLVSLTKKVISDGQGDSNDGRTDETYNDKHEKFVNDLAEAHAEIPMRAKFRHIMENADQTITVQECFAELM